MQEALSRLCGQSINQIKGTRFEFCPRRDANGQPLEAPYHPELKTQLDHLSFMMYDRQQELDNCRDYSNHKSAVTTSVNYAPRFKPGCSEMVEIVRWGPNAHTGRPFGRPNHFQTTGQERAA